MKLASVVVGVAVASLVTIGNAPLQSVAPHWVQAAAEESSDVTGLTAEQKIAMLSENKGQFGSGDMLRRFFFGDLLPISVQPGGAGMVVNLYNSANDVTIAYCATYDVVVAVGQGRITEFPSDQVQ